MAHYDFHFHARLFSPATGRWTAMDPLCEKYYSLSPYAHCAANPVNIVDPQGDSIIVNNWGYILSVEGEDNKVLLRKEKHLEQLGFLGETIDINEIYSNLLETSIREYK